MPMSEHEGSRLGLGRQLRLHALLIASGFTGLCVARSIRRCGTAHCLATRPVRCSNCLVMPSARQAQSPRVGTAEKLPGGDIFVDLLSRNRPGFRLQGRPVKSH